MLKFVVGLTDMVDYDGFIYDDQENNTDSVNYNIRKPATDVEQATIEWRINVELDAIKNVIPVWEKVIRAPHLCMIRINSNPVRYYPEFKEYILFVSYINLIPMASDLIKQFSDNDYDQCNGEVQFGDLCIQMHENMMYDDLHKSNIDDAYFQKDISILANADVRGSVVPKFFAQFLLRGDARPHSWLKDQDFINFITAHQDAIKEKGYNINSKRITNYGSIAVGKLLTDPNEAYENLTNYPRICRTSFVQTED
jgi:hypothetical protein